MPILQILGVIIGPDLPSFHRLTQLEKVTQSGDQRAMDAMNTFDAKVLVSIEQPFILKVRDEVHAARGRWLANQVVAVLSIVLGWGVPGGIVATNAAKGVPKIRRPKKLGVANKAWRPAKVDAFIKATYGIPFGGSGRRKAVAVAYYGGLRKEDVVRVPKVARANGSIDMDMINKNGKELSIFKAKRPTAILNEPDSIQMGRAAKRDDRKVAHRLLLNRLGQPYAKDGLDSSFDRIKRQLVKEGNLRPGLTFHGLRKSLGKAAADAGFSETSSARSARRARAFGRTTAPSECVPAIRSHPDRTTCPLHRRLKPCGTDSDDGVDETLSV